MRLNLDVSAGVESFDIVTVPEGALAPAPWRYEDPARARTALSFGRRLEAEGFVRESYWDDNMFRTVRWIKWEGPEALLYAVKVPESVIREMEASWN